MCLSSHTRFGGLRWRGVLALNFIRRTELPPCTNVSAKHGTPAIANPLLCAGFLSVRSGVVSSLHTFYKKRFTLEALSARLAPSPWVGEKKIKKKRGGKKFFLGGRKKYSLASFGLCGCLVRLARVYFFCAVAVFLFSGVKILFAGANFLFAGANFLSDVVNFLFAGSHSQTEGENFGLSGGKSPNDEGSFAFAGRNSLSDVVGFLSDVVRLRLLHFLKL